MLRSRMTSSSAAVRSTSTAGPAVTRPLWTHAAGLWTFSCLEAHQFVGALGPIAEQRPGVAGVDDLLDAETLGGPERRAHRVQALLDLPVERLRVLGRLELAPVGGQQPARDRQRAPVARRPCPAHAVAAAVDQPGARHA